VDDVIIKANAGETWESAVERHVVVNGQDASCDEPGCDVCQGENWMLLDELDGRPPTVIRWLPDNVFRAVRQHGWDWVLARLEGDLETYYGG
jgi:hypothetical protein